MTQTPGGDFVLAGQGETAGEVPVADGAGGYTWGLPLTGSVTLESLGAVGDGITDDTAAFQAAAKLGPAVITGAKKRYKVTSAVSLYTDSTHNAQGQTWDMRGCTITTTSTTDGILRDTTAIDGVTFRKGFTVVGGTWVGSGIQAWTGQIFAAALLLDQWTDVEIWGGDYSLFTASAAVFRGCGRVAVRGSTVHDICSSGGYNAWNFLDSINANVVNALGLEGQFTFEGNIAYPGATGIPTAHLGVISTEGNYANFDATVEGNNSIVNGNANFFFEVNSYSSGAGESFSSRCTVTDNNLVNLGTSPSSVCIWMQDDGANKFNDPLKIANHLIESNNMMCASNSTPNAGQPVLSVQASRTSVKSNRVRATGTNGACFSNNASDSTIMQDLTLEGNDFIQENAAATSRIVFLRQCSGASIKGGRIASKATTAYASLSGNVAAGLYVDSTCDHTFVGGDIEIEGALGPGIHAVSASDLRIDGFKIRNPNAANGSNAHNDTAGITLQGAPVGTVNLIENGSIVDDRGTPQMNWYILTSTTPTTKPSVRNVYGFGAATAPINAGSAGFYNEFTGTTGFEASFAASANTAGTSPFVTAVQPYDQFLSIKATNGMTAMTYSRGTTALPTVAGTGVLVRRGESVTMTWATTAPTYALIPMP